MSKDRAPLYFDARLGGLFPSNRVAEEALREIKGRCRVQITGGQANQRRRGMFWAILALVVPLLNERYNMTLDDNDLHQIMRDKFRMYDEAVLPSGEVHKRYWSTSNRAMNEADRAEYLNRCLAVWETWLGIDPTTLKAEAERS